MRGLAYTRDMRDRHIKRKKRIIRDHEDYWFYKFDGLLDKGKIHCSCGMCSRYHKTNNKGHRRTISGNYAPSKNWSHTDQQKQDSLNDQEAEL